MRRSHPSVIALPENRWIIRSLLLYWCVSLIRSFSLPLLFHPLISLAGLLLGTIVIRGRGYVPVGGREWFLFGLLPGLLFDTGASPMVLMAVGMLVALGSYVEERIHIFSFDVFAASILGISLVTGTPISWWGVLGGGNLQFAVFLLLILLNWHYIGKAAAVFLTGYGLLFVLSGQEDRVIRILTDPAVGFFAALFVGRVAEKMYLPYQLVFVSLVLCVLSAGYHLQIAIGDPFLFSLVAGHIMFSLGIFFRNAKKRKRVEHKEKGKRKKKKK